MLLDTMVGKQHHFSVTTMWTGDLGTGTSNYRAYSRDHEISGDTKYAPIQGSSDPAFRGDSSRYNPEELLVASLSACHMLWFLHFCAEAGVIVTGYKDEAKSTMRLNADGSGEFTEVVLRPIVDFADPLSTGEVSELHERAHASCFIARSMNFPVRFELH